MSKVITITKNHKEFKSIEFVNKARSRDKIKPIFTILNFDNGKVMASDSRRLHISQTEIEENGFFEVVKATKSEIILVESGIQGQFPNVDQIIYSDEKIKDCEFSQEKVEISPLYGFFKVTAVLLRALSSKMMINLDYVKDALQDYAGAVTIICNPNDAMTPIQFNYDNGKAVIMPILLK